MRDITAVATTCKLHLHALLYHWIDNCTAFGEIIWADILHFSTQALYTLYTAGYIGKLVNKTWPTEAEVPSLNIFTLLGYRFMGKPKGKSYECRVDKGHFRGGHHRVLKDYMGYGSDDAQKNVQSQYGQSTQQGQSSQYGQSAQQGQSSHYGQSAQHGQSFHYGQSSQYGQSAQHGQSSHYGQSSQANSGQSSRSFQYLIDSNGTKFYYSNKWRRWYWAEQSGQTHYCNDIHCDNGRYYYHDPRSGQSEWLRKE